jgi:hypothetical protein
MHHLLLGILAVSVISLLWSKFIHPEIAHICVETQGERTGDVMGTTSAMFLFFSISPPRVTVLVKADDPM